MRILHILDNIAIMSGVSSVVMNIYRNINRDKFVFDFLVATRCEYSYEEDIKQLGGNVYYFGNPLSLNTLIEANKNVKNFFKEKASMYDCVHLHSPTISEFTLRYAKLYGVKSRIIHSHSTMTSPNIMKAIINSFLTLRVRSLANNYWACSTEAAKYLFGDNICSNHKYILVYNAINCNNYKFNPDERKIVREELKISDNYIIGHISNFSKIKNHMFLIDVIEQVVNKNDKFKFIFVGDGKTRNEFEEKLKEKSLMKYCIFTGRTDNVQKYLQICDLIVLPSLKEGLPVTIVEAQACGLPCILNNTITKDVKVGDVEYFELDHNLWANRILLRSFQQNDERMIKSENFSESVFSIINEIKRIEDYYLKLLG